MPSTVAFHPGQSVASICRLCFMERNQLEQIFEDANGDFTGWIEKLTSLKIVHVPNAPASLCSDCKSTLEAFDAFREMCITNDLVFKEAFCRDPDYWPTTVDSPAGELKTECDGDQPAAVQAGGGNALVMCEIPREPLAESDGAPVASIAVEEYEAKVRDVDTSVEIGEPIVELTIGEEGNEWGPVAGMELTMVDDAMTLAGQQIDIDSSVESDEEAAAADSATDDADSGTDGADSETDDATENVVEENDAHMPLTIQAVLLDKRKYRCKICKFKYASKMHTLTHLKPQLFECCVCTARYKQFGIVSKHIRRRHRKKDTLVTVKRYVERHGNQVIEIDDNDGDDAQPQVVLNDSFNSVSASASSVTVGGYEIITEVEVDSSVEDGDLAPAPEDQQDSISSDNREYSPGPPKANAFGRYKCKVCNATTSKLHVMTHRGYRTFRCYICMRNFDRMSSCSNHITIHKQNKWRMCQICKTSKSKLHIMTHKPEGFQCYICKRLFAKMDNVSKHIKLHSKNAPPNNGTQSAASAQDNDIDSCVEIDYSPSRANLQYCKICRKSYSKLHAMSHKSKQKFVCQICSDVFVSMARLGSHVRNHPKKKPKVVAPGKHFRKSAPSAEAAPPPGNFMVKIEYDSPSVKREPNTDDPPAETRLIECRICNTNVSKLHIMTHKIAGLFRCPMCRKKFPTFGSVSKHIRIHRDAGKFVCEFCKKSFSTASNLTRHRKTHFRR